jgi:hypothetical protein
MGQAKNRGTFEQRQQQAIIKNKQLDEQRQKLEQNKRLNRPSKIALTSGRNKLGLATLIAMAAVSAGCEVETFDFRNDKDD